MRFHSILSAQPEYDGRGKPVEQPPYFRDLHLDQIIEAITADKQEYNLEPFYYTPLHNVKEIRYRQEIMRDLEDRQLLDSVRSFSDNMRTMRKYLAQSKKLYYKHQKQRWFLDAVGLYCDSIDTLTGDLVRAGLQARGFIAFREYIADYTASSRFTALRNETKRLQADLSGIVYCLLIKGNRVQVQPYDAETDYSADVEATFARFQQGAVKSYLVKFPDWPEMNHVEANILSCVAKLHPEIFSRLDDYCSRNISYADERILEFDREIQF